MAVYEAIRNLVQYGVNTGLLQESDRMIMHMRRAF